MGVTGFTKVKERETIKRLILAVDGLEKQGKTHFALTAPGPIAYLDFDIGSEGVLEKFLAKKEIHLPTEGSKQGRASFQLPIKAGQPVNIDECVRLWEDFKKLYCNALQSEGLRTIIIDTATEMWELLRLSRFGKLLQVMPHQYGPVNAEYRELIRLAYGFNKNLILLHKKKAQYINEKRTGKYERAGFSETGFLVQCNADVTREDDGTGDFCLNVRDCRQNPDIAGEDFSGPMCSFPMLASFVFQGTSPKDWE